MRNRREIPSEGKLKGRSGDTSRFRWFLAATIAIALAMVSSGVAQGFVIGGGNYVPSGSGETVTAVFNTPDGGISANNYAGFVEITVSGTGQSYSTYFNDAFYVYDPGPAPTSDAGYYQLTFSRTTLTGGTILNDAANYIVYDIDAGHAVTPPYLPAYRTDHTYHIILNVGSSPSKLHFGVSDGDYSDNSGSFTIIVQQLALATVSAPTLSAWGAILLILMLGGFAIRYAHKLLQ